MTSGYRACVACPFCESGELRFTPFLACCEECGSTMSRSFFEALHQIRILPEVEEVHACGCGHLKMHGLASGFRCPACGRRIRTTN